MIYYSYNKAINHHHRHPHHFHHHRNNYHHLYHHHQYHHRHCCHYLHLILIIIVIIIIIRYKSFTNTRTEKNYKRITFKILLQENIQGLIGKMTFQMKPIVQKPKKTRKIRIKTMKV